MNRSLRGLLAAAFLLTGLVGCRPASPYAVGDRAPLDGATPKIAFIEDDYAQALRRAKAEHLPLFVDAWAPWCHTCLSMKAYVFGDAALARVSSKFVWASIDTEKSENEAFTKKFPMEVWPTLWVIEPGEEKPLLKWLGSATANELAVLLEQATAERTPSLPGSVEATAAWLRGNYAVAEGHRDVALREYHDALWRAPQGYPGRASIVEAYVGQLQAAEQNEECLALSIGEWPSLPPGTSRLNVALAGLSCGSSLPPAGPRQAELGTLAREAEELAEDPQEPILADDRSSLFEELVSFFHWDDKAPEAKSTAEKWLAFLDGEAARAPSPAARVVFDSHRMEALTEIGQPERALPLLEQSERDFPGDYNAPSRLAKVNLQLGRFDAALLAIGRAEQRVYGPRKLRVLWLKADILMAMKRPDDAKRVLVEAIRLGEGLELTGGYRQLLTKIRQRAAELAPAGP